MLPEIYDRIIRDEIDSYKRGRTIFSMTNCPNCGAPITSHQCEYCGTMFNTLKQCDHDDILGMHKTAERLLASGVITANEARELCGLDRISTPERNPTTINKLYEDAIRAMRDYARV